MECIYCGSTDFMDLQDGQMQRLNEKQEIVNRHVRCRNCEKLYKITGIWTRTKEIVTPEEED